MTRLVPAAALALLTAACFADNLVGEERSPDGALVARAWCIDLCDAPEARTITIGKPGATDRSDAPDRDTAAKVYILPRQGRRLILEWTSPRALTVTGPCLADLNFRPLPPRRFRDVSIRFVRSPGDEPCWRTDAPAEKGRSG